ncbi:hypothetical protein FB451DRAFT_1565842 [Mycena latifolia]|nr:hypothetical protein FB451DRAFT_1565842 [Mycena latifolia]
MARVQARANERDKGRARGRRRRMVQSGAEERNAEEGDVVEWGMKEGSTTQEMCSGSLGKGAENRKEKPAAAPRKNSPKGNEESAEKDSPHADHLLLGGSSDMRMNARPAPAAPYTTHSPASRDTALPKCAASSTGVQRLCVVLARLFTRTFGGMGSAQDAAAGKYMSSLELKLQLYRCPWYSPRLPPSRVGLTVGDGGVGGT